MPQLKKHDYERTPLGNRLAKLRKAAGLTAADLAALVPSESITKQVIVNIETGRKADPPVFQLLQLASALHVSLFDIIFDTEHPLSVNDAPDLPHPFDEMSVGEFLIAFDPIRRKNREMFAIARVAQTLSDVERLIVLLDYVNGDLENEPPGKSWEFAYAYGYNFSESSESLTNQLDREILIRDIVKSAELLSIMLDSSEVFTSNLDSRVNLGMSAHGFKFGEVSDSLPRGLRERIGLIYARANELKSSSEMEIPAPDLARESTITP